MGSKNRKVFLPVLIEALEAGMAAGEAVKPVPMTVVSGDGSKQWHVPDGVCGFAGIKIRPANSAFAKFLVAEGKARKDYGGGVYWGVHHYNQSLARKEAYAYAVAEVFQKYGFKAYATSRMD